MDLYVYAKVDELNAGAPVRVVHKRIEGLMPLAVVQADSSIKGAERFLRTFFSEFTRQITLRVDEDFTLVHWAWHQKIHLVDIDPTAPLEQQLNYHADRLKARLVQVIVEDSIAIFEDQSR